VHILPSAVFVGNFVCGNEAGCRNFLACCSIYTASVPLHLCCIFTLRGSWDHVSLAISAIERAGWTQ